MKIKQILNEKMITLITILLILLCAGGLKSQTPKNIIFILSDDHRYDFMGFHPNAPSFLKTPGMDRMAKEGAHLANAFVTTSLCSPSRASILTGQYAFRHGAVDNVNPMNKDVVFFPGRMKLEGYNTGFFGKWHIGQTDDTPQPGFDRWVGFKGQGLYYDPALNIDGNREQVKGYITDLLTDYAIDWLDEVSGREQPFFLYLSHKAVHAEFDPATRHKGMYKDEHVPVLQSMKNIERNYAGKPDWVQEQRYSWHGIDYMYHERSDHPKNMQEITIRYSEALMAVDESINRILDYLEEEGLSSNTLVIYMGDNGFMLGEHGLIDKRNAYEESIRVPLLAWSPGFIKARTVITENVLNIDIAPTFLDVASGEMPEGYNLDGTSFLPLLAGKEIPAWRNSFYYQYYWEDAYPQTPTTYAVRNNKYKYIYYHGIWDKNELYDLQTDPQEMVNLIDIPAYKNAADSLNTELFNFMEGEQATDVRFRRPIDYRDDERKIH